MNKWLKDYSMSEVLMTNEYLINANKKTTQYLKEFDLDRCVEGFRRTAGIGKGADTYGGWETSLIAGHAIGHYVSAVAQGYRYSTAGTPDTELLRLSDEITDALCEAQIKTDSVLNGASVKKGYLFATTDARKNGCVVTGEGQFDNVEAGKTNMLSEAWVPWYTMHKILAGLIDTYKFTDNKKAFKAASELGNWVYNRVSGYDEKMQKRVLATEYGGMNDALYELYMLTGDIRHAKAAHMFDEISLFDELFAGRDILKDKHANTTIPKVIGALTRYIAQESTELTSEMLGDSHDAEYYLTVAKNFFAIVRDNHCYITGGTGQDEHFRSACDNDACRDNVNNETCAAYNMLKIARGLFKITKNRQYADYYENTFLNAIAASQNPETGMTMYFQPMGTGYFKLYSSRWDDFWCCTATGLENFTKLTDSIYYKGDNRIVVAQYISSVLTDRENNIRFTQASTLPTGDTATFAVEPLAGDRQRAVLALRVPDWAVSPTVSINGSRAACEQSDGFIELDREWSKGDRIEITLPMELRAYGLLGSETAVAFKYGPTVLSVGYTDNDTDEAPHGEGVRKPKNKTVTNETVTVNKSYGTREKWLADLNNNFDKADGRLEFTMKNTDRPLVFTPHYSKYKERYGIYWYLTDNVK